MSGVCGLVHLDGAPVDPALLRAMAEASAYRGTAGILYSIREHAGLAQLASRTAPGAPRRRQPLESSDGELCITADARIDERDELIALLTSKGHLRAPDPTDAALLLAAYRCWGEECPDRIVGDFAFAIWDRPRRTIFCARDVMGARALHFSWDGATFRFASDPRQILADRAVSRDLDGYAIADYLTLTFRLEPRTIFAEVKTLLPGHCLTVDRKGLHQRRYWTPDPEIAIRYRREEEYLDHFRELLFRCVADRLRGSRSAAVMTSGGIDSSALCVAVQELHRLDRVSTQPVAYTLVFGDELRACDERRYSMTLADEKGIELHQVVAERDCSLAEMLDHPPALDGPWMQHVGSAHEMLRRARERGCSVVLTGDGGDELFHAGKLQYWDLARSGRWWKLGPWIAAERQEGRSALRAAAALAVWPVLPRRVRYTLDGWMGGTRFARVPSWIRPELSETAARARSSDSAVLEMKRGSYARRQHHEIITGFPARGAATLDLWSRSALAYDLEASFPLLDRRLAQFALALPLEFCARPGRHNTKWPLRQALRGALPDKIRLQRTKGGGGGTYLKFIFCQRSRDEVRKIFRDTLLARLDLVDEEGLNDDLTALCTTRSDPAGAGWLMPTLSMELWLRAHDLGRSAVRFRPA